MMIKNSKLYDVLKFIALIALPSVGTLYFALAAIWGLPNADEVAGTILAVDTFLGVLLGISTAVYNRSEEKFDGSVGVVHDDSIRVNVDLRDLLEKDEIHMKVEPPQDSPPGD